MVQAGRRAFDVGEDLGLVQVHQLWGGEELSGSKQLSEAPACLGSHCPARGVHQKLRVEEYTEDFEILAREEGPVQDMKALLGWVEENLVGSPPFFFFLQVH